MNIIRHVGYQFALLWTKNVFFFKEIVYQQFSFLKFN